MTLPKLERSKLAMLRSIKLLINEGERAPTNAREAGVSKRDHKIQDSKDEFWRESSERA
jgi:hypothetical protein